MARKTQMLLLFLYCLLVVLPAISHAIGCDGACNTDDDCDGQLACIAGRCNDDAGVGTHICSGGGGGGGGNQCTPKDPNSPPVTGSTQAILTLNDFSEGGDGGGKSKCDEQWHDNSEQVVALSTGWFDNRSRCLKMIRITANGRNTLAKVVDECDSIHGCDAEHAFQSSTCDNNIVDGSQAVWDALGLNTELGRVPVTWTDA